MTATDAQYHSMMMCGGQEEEVWRDLVFALTSERFVEPRELSRECATDLMRAHGVHDFVGREISLPRYPDIWDREYPGHPRDDSGPIALPHPSRWARWLCPMIIVQRMRDATGSPVKIAHVWRPARYNEAAGGASGSDHLHCCAVDCDVTAGTVTTALLVLADAYRDDRLTMSIGWHSGLRKVRFHVGVSSPHRAGWKADWDYDKENRRWLERFAKKLELRG